MGPETGWGEYKINGGIFVLFLKVGNTTAYEDTDGNGFKEQKR